MYKAGGGNEIPEYLEQYLISGSPAHVAFQHGVKSFKDGKFSRDGSAVLKEFRILDLTELEAETPEARWQICVDQSEVKTTKDGKPFKVTPYIDEQISIQFDRKSSSWKVYSISSRKLPDGQDCETA